MAVASECWAEAADEMSLLIALCSRGRMQGVGFRKMQHVTSRVAFFFCLALDCSRDLLRDASPLSSGVTCCLGTQF